MKWCLAILLIFLISITTGQVQSHRNVTSEILERARILFEIGQYEQAIGQLDHILILDRTNFDALRLRAMAYQNMQSFEMALIDYHILVRLDPDNLDAFFGLAVVEFRMGQFKESIGHFRRVLELEEKETESVYFALDGDGFISGVNSMHTLHGEVYNYLGLAHQELKECDKSINSFQMAWNNQEKVSYLMNLGNAYQECLQDSLARQTYHQILNIYPEYAEAQLALLELTKSSDLLEGYNAILANNQDSYSAYVHRGMLLMEHEDFSGAIDDFKRATQIDSSELEPWFNIGLCYNAMGRHHFAKKAFLNVIKINPTFYRAYSALGNLAMKTFDFEDAINWYSQAIQLDRAGYLFYNRAVAYHHLNMDEMACSDWWMARQLKFTPPEPVDFCEEDVR